LTVTISAGSLKPKLDLYFLCDTTGSMMPALPSVRSVADSVISSLVASGAEAAFGAGSYKDFFGGGPAFNNDAQIDIDPSSARSAIASWTVSGGGDVCEAQLYALDQVAEDPKGPIGWREGATAVLIWFGDEPGHDPICISVSGLPYEITSRSVMQQLNAQMITVAYAGAPSAPQR
jgi:hypothetical protein